MSGLAEQLAAVRRLAEQASNFRVGMVVETTNSWRLNVGGSEVDTWWPHDYDPTHGDTVLAVQVGQTWHVVTVIERVPRVEEAAPIVGRVKTVPSGASRITVTVDGVDMQLGFLASYSPSVGDDVALLWQDGFEDPLVLGKRGSVPVPKPRPAPKPTPKPKNPSPPRKRTGRNTFTATDGGPWSATAGGWSSTQGRNVMQGNWSGLSYDGFWFYGNKIRNRLKGARVTKCEIYIPNRLRMGMYNNSAIATIRRHTSNATRRTSGKPSQTGSSVNINVPRIGTTRGWVTVSRALGQALVDNGGGVALVGNTYLGFPGPGSGAGRNSRSGAIRISWER